jgi:hypothetical protein
MACATYPGGFIWIAALALLGAADGQGDLIRSGTGGVGRRRAANTWGDPVPSTHSSSPRLGSGAGATLKELARSYDVGLATISSSQ